MKQPLAKTKGVEPNDSCACTPTWIFHSQSSSGDSHVAATSPKAGAHAAEAIHLDPGNTQEHMFTMGPSLTSSRLGGQQYNQWTCPVQHTAGGSVLHNNSNSFSMYTRGVCDNTTKALSIICLGQFVECSIDVQ